MTKADIVSEIAKNTGVEKVQVMAIVEAFMDSVKGSLENGENVYLRGFGSFIIILSSTCSTKRMRVSYSSTLCSCTQKAKSIGTPSPIIFTCFGSTRSSINRRTEKPLALNEQVSSVASQSSTRPSRAGVRLSKRLIT